MTGPVDLLRPEIRQLRPYRPADYAAGLVRLNANETPWPPPGGDTVAGLNRYPDPRPRELTERLAAYYRVAAEQILVTRGSSEGIDVLLRGFCAAGRDEIVICPPTFGMYEVYARIQDAGVRAVPLDREAGYGLPLTTILTGWTPATKLVFVCSPNNPTGTLVPTTTLHELCAGLAGRGVVVVDEAYAEFAATDPTRELLDQHANVLVLRTLSKAMGLAGARCGALLGPPGLLEILGRVLPPYSFPTSSSEAVLRCLTPAALAELDRRRSVLLVERGRLAAALAARPDVRRVWPSEANFLLVEVGDAAGFVARARAGGVLVRDFSWDPALPAGVRITVGTPAENDRLLAALGN